ncbi:hypothetical protein ACWGLP_09845 [Streptomyces lydicus]
MRVLISPHVSEQAVLAVPAALREAFAGLSRSDSALLGQFVVALLDGVGVGRHPLPGGAAGRGGYGARSPVGVMACPVLVSL